MSKYFFDRSSTDRAEYDYTGSLHRSLDEARKIAELIALDLGMGTDTPWSGWRVDVRNAQGERFFSIPVPSAELAAA